MKFSSRQPEAASMQMAPMIDIVFLLLIFFIVTWNYTRAETELSVSVPTAQEGAEPNRRPYEIIINLLADGSIRVESVTIDLDQLHDRLEPIARQAPNQPVRIRGDASASFQNLVDVVDICQRAGIWNISFATQRPREE